MAGNAAAGKMHAVMGVARRHSAPFGRGSHWPGSRRGTIKVEGGKIKRVIRLLPPANGAVARKIGPARWALASNN